MNISGFRNLKSKIEYFCLLTSAISPLKPETTNNGQQATCTLHRVF